jgi:hypothetical protein
MALSPVAQALTQQFEGHVIRYRNEDGYIHATDMCKVGGKKKPWSTYKQNKSTANFIEALGSDIGIPMSQLVQSISGNAKAGAGTWIHPHIAINLAQWVSPMFAVFVSKLTARFLSGDLTLTNDIVERQNDISGKANNISITTNPADSKTVAVVTTNEIDSIKQSKLYQRAHAKYLRYKNMCAEQTDIIAKKDKILDDNKAAMEENKVALAENRVALAENKVTISEKNCKIDELMLKVDELLGHARETNAKLDTSNAKLDTSNAKLDRVLCERVDLSGVPNKLHHQIVILRAYGPNRNMNHYSLYVIRAQKRSITSRIITTQNAYKKHGLRRWLTIDHPNATILWNNFKKEYPVEFEYCRDSNFFDIKGAMTYEAFEEMINYINSQRRIA